MTIEGELISPVWEKQLGEGDRAFQHFVAYRQISPLVRTAQRLVDTYGDCSSLSQIQKWSSLNRWRIRAAAFDQHVAQEADARIIERRRTAADQHYNALDRGIKSLLVPLSSLEDSIEGIRSALAIQVEEGQAINFGDAQDLMMLVKHCMSVLPKLVETQRLVLGMREEHDDEEQYIGQETVQEWVLDDGTGQLLYEILFKRNPLARSNPPTFPRLHN